jgi:hypothetical protein
MPARGDLRLTETAGDLFVVEDLRTDPPTSLGTIERVYPNGFDDLPRWPFSTVEGAFGTFIGPDE